MNATRPNPVVSNPPVHTKRIPDELFDEVDRQLAAEDAVAAESQRLEVDAARSAREARAARLDRLSRVALPFVYAISAGVWTFALLDFFQIIAPPLSIFAGIGVTGAAVASTVLVRQSRSPAVA